MGQEEFVNKKASTADGSTNQMSEAIPEFLKIQLQQAVETYRQQWILAIQIEVALMAGNAAVVGAAVGSKLAFVFWIGALFPFFSLIIWSAITKVSRPLVTTAIEIEKRFSPIWHKGLMTSWISENRESVSITDVSSLPKVMPGRKLFQAILVVVLVVELVLPFVLNSWFGWRMF